MDYAEILASIYTVCCYLIAFIGKKLYGSPRKEKMRETVLAE